MMKITIEIDVKGGEVVAITPVQTPDSKAAGPFYVKGSGYLWMKPETDKAMMQDKPSPWKYPHTSLYPFSKTPPWLDEAQSIDRLWRGYGGKPWVKEFDHSFDAMWNYLDKKTGKWKNPEAKAAAYSYMYGVPVRIPEPKKPKTTWLAFDFGVAEKNILAHYGSRIHPHYAGARTGRWTHGQKYYEPTDGYKVMWIATGGSADNKSYAMFDSVLKIIYATNSKDPRKTFQRTYITNYKDTTTIFTKVRGTVEEILKGAPVKSRSLYEYRSKAGHTVYAYGYFRAARKLKRQYGWTGTYYATALV